MVGVAAEAYADVSNYCSSLLFLYTSMAASPQLRFPADAANHCQSQPRFMLRAVLSCHGWCRTANINHSVNRVVVAVPSVPLSCPWFYIYFAKKKTKVSNILKKLKAVKHIRGNWDFRVIKLWNIVLCVLVHVIFYLVRVSNSMIFSIVFFLFCFDTLR